MYLWELVGHDCSLEPRCSGIGHELAPIMRSIEGQLTAGRGFIGHVTEVVPRISVDDLGAVHVPTGRVWLGRRDSRGGVHWEARHHHAAPDDVLRWKDARAS